VHVGNAFESEGGTTLDIDLGVFDSADILNKLKMASLRQGSEEGSDITVCQYMRLSLPLSESDPDAAEGSSSLPVRILLGLLPSRLRPAAGLVQVQVQLYAACGVSRL
jgi:hypothetical protein